MNKLILAVISIFLCSAAHAGPKKSLVDLDKELKQAKSTDTVMGLLGQFEQAVPETEADMALLGQMLDQYPDFARKAALNIKDPKLAKAVMKEAKKQIDTLQPDKEKDWNKLPTEKRKQRMNALMNAYSLLGTLGKLKNKEAVPFLKQYITPEYDGTLSYTASQAMGRIAPDDPAVFKELWNKKDVKNINYSGYGKSMLKEVSQKLQAPAVSEAEKNTIRSKSRVELLSGSTPEEKRLLKDIVRNHPDEWLRKDAGLAMAKALMFHPDEDDVDFVLEWTKDPKDDASAYAMTYMRDHFNSRFTPRIINFLREGHENARDKAVGLCAQHDIKEALPYIKECITKDKSSAVRGNCRATYWKMTGEYSSDFTPEDAQRMERYLTLPQVIKINSRRDDADPSKKQYLAQKEALAKYKAAQQR